MDKQITKKFLSSLDGISFKATLWDGEEVMVGSDPPTFITTIKKPLSKSNLLKSTTLELGESYMKEYIDIEGDLYQALNSLLSQMPKFSTKYSMLPKIFRKNYSMKHQKDDVTYHYDIGNEFYKLWLDETLSYSCAYFKSETDSLHDAQLNKIHHLLKKLNLKEGETLLDIGCGWGYLLIEAALKYKIKGVGITLSKEQAAGFTERIKELHLEDYLTVIVMDYRELEKSNMTFDKVVSVGMLEHVGRDNYDLFFQNVNAVLKDNGIFLLHFISSLKETDGDAWIKKYIFPGGIIPSIREIISIGTDFSYHTIDVESLRPHYAKTLLCWYDNFNKNIEPISKMFNKEFIRMWQLYLASCSAMFNNGFIDLHQITFTKGTNNDIPLTRDYLYKMD